VVRARATISRDGTPIITVSSEFILQGGYDDYHNTHELNEEQVYKLPLKSRQDVVLLVSKPWFRIAAADLSLDDHLDEELMFQLSSSYHFRDANTYS
jgi:fatty acid synthase subunit beta